MSKVIWDCVGFALLRSMIGSENSRYSLNRSDVKIKTNDDLVTRIFPRFTQFACFFFGSYWFSRYSLFPDGPFRNFGFCFTKII